MSKEISIGDFDYDLPVERIAQQAAMPRDSSKLLLFEKGTISDHVFNDLSDVLPEGSTMFFNDAKVIPARILVKNGNGAQIEIFLLQPYETDYLSAVNAGKETVWTCLIGNKKKWKPSETLVAHVKGVQLEMRQVNEQAVSFSWTGEHHFIELLESLGNLPLPPYIKHTPGKDDNERYQTVYSKAPGSVAAPTAGLHFSEQVLETIRTKGIVTEHLTLHVSAGTFLPVKVDNALEHRMHKEMFSISLGALKTLKGAEKVVAVGTTSCRVLESLYYCGVNLINQADQPFHVSQFNDASQPIEGDEALDALINYCESRGLVELHGETSIMIYPGFTFRYVDGLVTNFHQPKSTLLLLISAFIGESWKKVYQHALEHEYRFLSYGDSSFLLP